GQTHRGTSSLDRAIVHRVSARRVLGNGRVPCRLAFGTDQLGRLLALSPIHFCYCQPENRLANVTRSEFLPEKYPAAEQATQALREPTTCRGTTIRLTINNSSKRHGKQKEIRNLHHWDCVDRVRGSLSFASFDEYKREIPFTCFCDDSDCRRLGTRCKRFKEYSPV